MIRFILRRYWAVIAVALALTMSVLDGTIVNVALPTLSREFGTSPSSTIWIVNAYQLTITMSLLSFSALGDIYPPQKSGTEICVGLDAGSDSIVCI